MFRGVDEDANASRGCCRGSAGVTVSAAARGIFLQPDELLNLAALLFDRLEPPPWRHHAEQKLRDAWPGPRVRHRCQLRRPSGAGPPRPRRLRVAGAGTGSIGGNRLAVIRDRLLAGRCLFEFRGRREGCF